MIVYEREVQIVNADYSKNRTRQKAAELAKDEIQADEIDSSFDNKAPERFAGDIQSFSRKSRMRLFRKFNRLNTKYLSKAIFVTCTASPEAIDPEEFPKVFGKQFLKFIRSKVPRCVYLWRLEPHKNGRPHFHMMIWSELTDHNLHSEYWKKQFRKEWRRLIGDHSRAAELYSCKIENIKSMQKMQVYLSKYMAKEDTTESQKIRGRRWAVSENFPQCPITCFEISDSEEQRLWKIAEAVLRRKGKGDLADKMSEFRNFGWSLWIPAEKAGNLLRLIGYYMIDNALESYGTRPPPEEIDALWDLIPEEHLTESSPETEKPTRQKSATSARQSETGSLFPGRYETHKI